jgi:hypothetical protein
VNADSHIVRAERLGDFDFAEVEVAGGFQDEGLHGFWV